MAHSGQKHTNSSQFYITLGVAPWLDGEHVVFGHVVGGESVVNKLQSYGSYGGKVKKKVEITNCGIAENYKIKPTLTSKMGKPEEYDLIVVGLGPMGLSTCYHASKQGLKVLGLEKFPKSGHPGTSSVGYTRLWRLSHSRNSHTKLQKHALKLWDEIEKETGRKIVEKSGYLDFGCKEKIQKNIEVCKRNNIPGILMTSKEITKKWPVFQNIPEDHIGFWTEEAGVVFVKEILKALTELSQK